MRDSKLNEVAGGNIDLRGAMGERQLFSSDISGFYAQHVKDLILNEINITWDIVDEDYFKYGIHIKEFNELQLKNIRANASPSNNLLPAVFIENGKAFSTNMKNKDIVKKNVEE